MEEHVSQACADYVYQSALTWSFLITNDPKDCSCLQQQWFIAVHVICYDGFTIVLLVSAQLSSLFRHPS